MDVFNSTNDDANVTNAPASEKGGNTKDKEAKNNSVSKMVEDVSPSIVGVINKQKVSGLESFLEVIILKVQMNHKKLVPEQA